MNTKQSLDTLVENLLLAQPVLHKRIMKIKPPDIPGIHISRIHFGILVALHHHESPVKEIANHFLISKPQMTFIMNQMVEAGLIKRTINRRDRRIKDTALTPKGEEIFRRCDEYLKNNIKKMFAGLTEQEISVLSESLRKLKEIGLRQESDMASPLTELVHRNRN